MPQGKQKQSLDFEKSLAELEGIVRRMEQGGQSLAQTLKDFERGMVLSEQCGKSLETARQRVEKLVGQDGKQGKQGNYKLEPLDEHGYDRGDG